MRGHATFLDERIDFDTEIPQGTCASCRMEPRAERLDIRLELGGEFYDITLCRDCLAEHTPLALLSIEGWGDDRS